MSDVIAAVESNELRLDDKTSMDSSAFRRVCLNEDHNLSQFQLVKKIASFIETCNGYFSYRQNRQRGPNVKQFSHQKQ